METERFDDVIVGTGQAGPSLAARLAAAGRTVAILERHRVGGSCVNYGCTPTKTLVASARAIHLARRGDELGFRVGEVEVDFARVKERMREVAGASNRGLVEMLEGTDGITLVRGHGRLSGPRTVDVGDRRIEGDRVFLNVGTRARRPEVPGLDEVGAMSNRDLIECDELPEHLLIVGGSYIGLEMAQVYRRFGSRVTVLEQADRLIAREDEDVSATVREMLQDEGVEVRLGTDDLSFEALRPGIRVSYSCEGTSRREEASHVLLAVGRVPNTDDLGLETAGVETDDRGFVEVDDRCRTSVEGIWALGDCNGAGAFTHTSYHDYEIVATDLLGGEPARRISDRIPCYALYTDPPLGRIGMTLREARESGREVLVGERPMAKVSRAREAGETRGAIRILVDADSEEILGASILGLSGDEVVHLLLDVMYAEAAYTTIARAVHIHPTVSELIPTVLQDLRPL